MAAGLPRSKIAAKVPLRTAGDAFNRQDQHPLIVKRTLAAKDHISRPMRGYGTKPAQPAWKDRTQPRVSCLKRTRDRVYYEANTKGRAAEEGRGKGLLMHEDKRLTPDQCLRELESLSKPETLILLGAPGYGQKHPCLAARATAR